MKRAKNEIDRNKRGREKLFDRSTGRSTVRNILIGSFGRDFESGLRYEFVQRELSFSFFFFLFSFPFKFTPDVLLEGFGRIEVIEKLSCPPLCFIAF